MGPGLWKILKGSILGMEKGTLGCIIMQAPNVCY